MDEDNEQTQLNNKKQQINNNEKLWQDLQIDFHLEAFRFPDNKIYGIINIIPESSRKLIKNFFLVINKSNRIELEPHYTHLSASGFNTNRKNPSAYIEAIPHNAKWSKELKTSKICYFFFTGEVFALSPIISFDWSNNKNDSKATLVIKWYHIGDKHAQKYILYLDDREIQYIRQKLIDDAFDIRISGFEPGGKHTFQLAARLNNGKETYRSDLIEFIVPNKELNNEASTEFITVSNEPIPPDLPAYIATKADKTEEDFKQNKNEEKPVNQNKNEEKPVNQNKNEEKPVNQNKKEEKPVNQNKKEEKPVNQNKNQLLEQIKKPEKEKKNNNKIHTCCNNFPHDTFPGIEHYFNNTINKLSSPEGSEDDTDDDDVIIPKA